MRDLEANNNTFARAFIIFYLYKQQVTSVRNGKALPQGNALHRALIFTRRRCDNVDRGNRDKNSIMTEAVATLLYVPCTYRSMRVHYI